MFCQGDVQAGPRLVRLFLPAAVVDAVKRIVRVADGMAVETDVALRNNSSGFTIFGQPWIPPLIMAFKTVGFLSSYLALWSGAEQPAEKREP